MKKDRDIDRYLYRVKESDKRREGGREAADDEEYRPRTISHASLSCPDHPSSGAFRNDLAPV